MLSQTSNNLAFAFLLLCTCTILKPTDAGKIKLCATNAANDVAIAGASVNCYDDDTFSNDDFMTSGITGGDGCVTMNYKTYNYKWWSCDGWDYCRNNPDIFCEVERTENSKCIAKFTTNTKNNQNQSTMAVFNAAVTIDSDFCHTNSGANGCGPYVLPDVLRDQIDDFSGFRDACNSHDVCYENCNKSRQTCEDEFLADMLDICDGEDDFLGCNVLAGAFAGGTTLAGGWICEESRQDLFCTQAQIDSCDL